MADSPPIRYRPWLHAYLCVLVIATFILIGIGGNVTSLGAGMAVPDGWTTYGYFTLAAPLDVWWYDLGKRWEHSHRIQGTIVGMLTIGATLWLGWTQRRRRWLGYGVGGGLLVLVIVQGTLGATRVTENSLLLAFIHGIVGQLFLCLTIFAAAATSRVWVAACGLAASPAGAPAKRQAAYATLRRLSLVLLAALGVQLILGAAMRHSGAGMAIPDFPSSYGHVLPPVTPASLDAVTTAYSLPQVWVHFSHRWFAFVVLGLAVWAVTKLNLTAPSRPETAWPARAVMVLIGVQILLGVWTIWSGGYPAMATAHQMTGAALLGTAVLFAIRVHLLARNEAARLAGDAQRPVGLPHDDGDAARHPLNTEQGVA